MAVVMKASEFIEKLKDVEKNHKTLYVMGCFGAPMTAANKKRYCDNHSYNRQASRTKMIKNCSPYTFGFDCVNLIKAILWGWTGDPKKTYGGAKYKSNGVPDTSADGMIKLCSDVSTDFSKIEVGEAVWKRGHIGVYIGDGLAIECTPAWKNKVQITAVKNIGAKAGYNARMWTKHGKIPYIEYDVKEKKATKNLDAALHKDAKLFGEYEVTATKLHIRTGAGTVKKSLGTLSKGSVVRNYGYYNTTAGGSKWLYVVASNGVTGYCSAKYLKKC